MVTAVDRKAALARLERLQQRILARQAGPAHHCMVQAAADGLCDPVPDGDFRIVRVAIPSGRFLDPDAGSYVPSPAEMAEARAEHALVCAAADAAGMEHPAPALPRIRLPLIDAPAAPGNLIEREPIIFETAQARHDRLVREARDKAQAEREEAIWRGVRERAAESGKPLSPEEEDEFREYLNGSHG